jgi:hypothetical protein
MIPALAIRAEIVRLWTVFNPGKPAEPAWVNVVAEQIEAVPPATVAAAVNRVIATEAAIGNAVFQIRQAVTAIRQGAAADTLQTLDEDGRARWRAINPPVAGSVLDRPRLPTNRKRKGK